MAESVDGQLLGEYWKMIGFCGRLRRVLKICVNEFHPK